MRFQSPTIRSDHYTNLYTHAHKPDLFSFFQSLLKKRMTSIRVHENNDKVSYKHFNIEENMTISEILHHRKETTILLSKQT